MSAALCQPRSDCSDAEKPGRAFQALHSGRASARLATRRPANSHTIVCSNKRRPPGSARLQLLAGPHAMRPQSPPRLFRMVHTYKIEVYKTMGFLDFGARAAGVVWGAALSGFGLIRPKAYA